MPYVVNGRGTLADRFWRRVVKTDGCWLWSGAHCGTGQAQIRDTGGKRTVYAYRVSWEIHNGPIPVGMCVCHKCDNPGCVNPAHLFLGTHADNMSDMQKKGRHRAPPIKLSTEAVEYIRANANGRSSQANLAREFGVRQSTISRIAHRLRRKQG